MVSGIHLWNCSFQGFWSQCDVYVVVYVSLDDFQMWPTQKVRCNHPSKAHLPFHFALEGHVPIQYGHLQGSRRAIAFGDYFQKCHS